MSKTLALLIVTMSIAPVAHADTDLSAILNQMRAAISPTATAVQFNAAGVQISGDHMLTLTANDADAVFATQGGFEFADWAAGQTTTDKEPVVLPPGMVDVASTLNWGQLATTLSAFSEFTDPSTPASSKLLFVTSVAYTQGPQYDTVPGYPLHEAKVQTALAKLSPNSILAIASVADPVAAKQCDKQPSPYWVIDLATSQVLLKGIDQPCFFPHPGGVSSSGGTDPLPN